MPAASDLERLVERIRRLAVDYERAVGRPLGVTGELAELVAARLLKLTPLPVRSPGADAIDKKGRRYQIKGRKLANPRGGMTGTVKATKDCDAVLLVLFDSKFRPIEILEASYNKVDAALVRPGSKARNERRQLSVPKFRSIAKQVWVSKTIA